MKFTPQQRWTATLTRSAAQVGSVAGPALMRLRGHAWAILQTSVATEMAWLIAHYLLGHPQPFFAPIAAAVCLSASTVLRAQRAVQMIFGVSLGIGIGVGVQALLHVSVLAVGVAVAVALCAAVVLGQGFFAEGLMFVNQTAISAILIIALAHSGTGTERLFDALVGGGIALVFSVVLFPADPVALLRSAIVSALAALSGTLTQLEDIIDERGNERVDAGWSMAEGELINGRLAEVAQACATARQVVRAAPRRRAARPVVEGLERQATQITLLAGAVLNLARTTAAAVRSGENPPEGLQAAISDLTQGLSGLANNDTAAASRAMTRAVDRMVDPHIASPTRAPLIALLTLGCGRDLEHLVALSESKPHSE
ncbi:MAG: hypothetical protein QOK33_3000 [Mycobacterium sp.]|nr:hypothetical protein [Mycobacterium sp.]MDT5399769.1 hypothetical protein [Mycobacterium sp.]